MLLAPLVFLVLTLVLGFLGLGKIKLLSWLFAAASMIGLGLVYWGPQSIELGFPYSLTLDPLGVLFATLVLGLGACIGVYAAAYFDPREQRGPRFYASLAVFQLGMLGLVMSQDWISLVVFWELTSLASFFLISFDWEEEKAQKGAIQALLVTSLGGLGLIVAGLSAWGVSGDWGIESSALAVGASPMATIAVLTGLALAVFTKSAQAPFHFWLPGAMAAPTPVSAYLHSATLVKAGIFLAAKFFPLYSQEPAWQLLSVVGLVTYVYCGFLAATRRDLKALLAASTSSHLGLILALFGLGTAWAYETALLHTVAHALFKAALFMVAGIVIHETGEKTLDGISRKALRLPVTRNIAWAAALSSAAFPFTLGFVSKENILKVVSESGQNWMLVMVLAGSALGALYLTHLLFSLFPKGSESKGSEDPSVGFWAAPALLAAMGLVLGALPSSLSAAFPSPSLVVLKSWFGWNFLFFAGFASMILGFVVWPFCRAAMSRLTSVLSQDPTAGFSKFLDLVVEFGRRVGELFQSRSVPTVLSLQILTICGVLFFLVRSFTGQGRWEWSELWSFASLALSQFQLDRSESWALFLTLGLMAALTALLLLIPSRKRWAGVFTLSGVGALMVVSFYFLGAPDLALTQTSVELVSLGLLASVLLLLGRSKREAIDAKSSKFGMLARVAASVAGAAAAFFAALWAFVPGADRSAAFFYGEHTLRSGGGANAVNVVVVDFRGFDTFGEIAVLGGAAVGFYLVLSFLKERPWIQINKQPQWLASAWRPQTLAPWLYLAWVLTLFVTFRGHNEPGGGFVGGLMGSMILLSVSFFDGRSKPVSGFPLIAIGFGVAWVATLIPVLWGGAVFRSYVLGGFATSTFFDLGLATLVTGSTLVLVNEWKSLWRLR
jgi:multicomponent K+:H+ antiporter subunit A